MLNKINKFLHSSIPLSILMFVIGIIFIIEPEASFNTITYILAIVLIINGIYFLFEKETSVFFTGFITFGVVEILLGVVMFLNPDIIKTLFPIVTGIIMISKSAIDLRFSFLLNKNGYRNWLGLAICAVISIACGLIIIFYPSIGTVALTTYLGILITVYSVSNIIDTIMFKKNINEIAKLLDR